MSDADPKIVVDDDWKNRVEREKKKMGGDVENDHEHKFPEASFELLITTFSMQAMSAMGLVGGPAGTRQPIDFGLAKHLIDLLGVIEEKTRGNLSGEEAGTLEQMLHQLRMLFIDPEVRKNAGAAGKPAKPVIELP